MKLLTIALITSTLTAGSAFAQSAMDPVVAQLSQAGYTNITYSQVGQTYKVYAMMNGQKREIIYDAQTGQILSDRLDSDGDGIMDHVIQGGDDNGSDDSSMGSNDNNDDNGNDHGRDNNDRNGHDNNNDDNDD